MRDASRHAQTLPFALCAGRQTSQGTTLADTPRTATAALAWRPIAWALVIFSCGLLSRSAICSEQMGLTVIPPGPVTDQVDVEIRASVLNSTSGAQEWTVDFYWDQADQEHLIEHQVVTAEADGFAFARAWWPTAGRAGKHRLLCRASSQTANAAGEWPIQVVSAESRALPLFQGMWLEPAALSNSVYPRNREVAQQDARDAIDAFGRLGVRVLILAYAEAGGSFFYPSKLRFFDRDLQLEVGRQLFPFDVFGTVLDQTDKHGMHVFLGLGRGGDLKLLWEFDKPDWKNRNEANLEQGRRVAQEIWEMDGSQGYGGAYAASFANVRRQLEIEARHVEMITAYEGFGMLEAPQSRVKLKDSRSARLFRDYEAYYRQAAGEHLP